MHGWQRSAAEPVQLIHFTLFDSEATDGSVLAGACSFGASWSEPDLVILSSSELFFVCLDKSINLSMKLAKQSPFSL